MVLALTCPCRRTRSPSSCSSSSKGVEHAGHAPILCARKLKRALSDSEPAVDAMSSTPPSPPWSFHGSELSPSSDEIAEDPPTVRTIAEARALSSFPDPSTNQQTGQR
eukprot:12824547-Alexandrium_andersonii.AAC.1